MINLIKALSPRAWANLIMHGLHGQTVSGYGFTTTFNFPADKRQEMLDEIFGVKRGK